MWGSIVMVSVCCRSNCGAPADEREDVANIQDIRVWSPALQKTVPVAQVVSGFETAFENTVIRGRDRIQTIITSCNPTGELATPLFNRLKPQIEAVELPPGYSLSWGGEYEDSKNAQNGLLSVLPGGLSVDDSDQHPGCLADCVSR